MVPRPEEEVKAGAHDGAFHALAAPGEIGSTNPGTGAPEAAGCPQPDSGFRSLLLTPLIRGNWLVDPLKLVGQSPQKSRFGAIGQFLSRGQKDLNPPKKLCVSWFPMETPTWRPRSTYSDTVMVHGAGSEFPVPGPARHSCVKWNQ